MGIRSLSLVELLIEPFCFVMCLNRMYALAACFSKLDNTCVISLFSLAPSSISTRNLLRELSIYKPTGERVNSNRLYGRWRLHLMGSWWDSIQLDWQKIQQFADVFITFDHNGLVNLEMNLSPQLNSEFRITDQRSVFLLLPSRNQAPLLYWAPVKVNCHNGCLHSLEQ